MQSPKSVSKKWMKLQSAAIARSTNPLKISLSIPNWAKNIFKIHSLCGRSKKGRGEVGGRKGKGKGALPLSPIPSPFSLPPYPLSPTPFDACYAGYKIRQSVGLFTSLLMGGLNVNTARRNLNWAEANQFRIF